MVRLLNSAFNYEVVKTTARTVSIEEELCVHLLQLENNDGAENEKAAYALFRRLAGKV